MRGPLILGERRFASPVMTASGCGGSGADLGQFLDLAALGATVSRTFTLDPRTPSADARYAETPSGLVTPDDHPNAGIHSYLATELPELLRAGATPIVSVLGRSLGEYAELARRAGGAPGVAALEVLLPDELDDAVHALSAVRRDTPRGVAVLAKLALDDDGLAGRAEALRRHGADAIVLGYGPRATAATTGGTWVRGRLSGPAVLPILLETVARVRAYLPDTPLIACGGITDVASAVQAFEHGADGVQVGSATFRDPAAALTIATALAQTDHVRSQQ